MELVLRSDSIVSKVLGGGKYGGVGGLGGLGLGSGL